MSFEDDFLEFMTDTVIIRNRTGQDRHNKPLYGNPVSYQARVTGRRRMMSGVAGQAIVSDKTVYLPGPVVQTITPDDQIEMADGTHPPIIGVGEYPDEDGPHHMELYLGAVS